MDLDRIRLYIEEDAEYVAQTAPPPKRMVAEKAHGCTVTMADGTEYLDLIAGISVNSVGATNPEVAAAVKEQVDKLAHAMVFGVYVVPVQVEVAKLLAQITGPNLQQTFFTNSGTEAIEGALKLARKYTGRKKLITMERGFHGRTFGSLSVTWREVYRKPYEPLVPMVEFIPFSDIKAAEQAEENRHWMCDEDIMELANSNAFCMHCLPADRNFEVTSAVMDGPQSAVFDQAENRLYAQKAIMALTMGARKRHYALMKGRTA